MCVRLNMGWREGKEGYKQRGLALPFGVTQAPFPKDGLVSSTWVHTPTAGPLAAPPRRRRRPLARSLAGGGGGPSLWQKQRDHSLEEVKRDYIERRKLIPSVREERLTQINRGFTVTGFIPRAKFSFYKKAFL